ncbi:pimeloyl-ACP methyl ester carboxylesterase [Sporomusaceae bacterium BoRhaA]|uniref:alpha/beta hydrolase n=1 Tax=Pelorhabdus rhamnosifermentans TaxID=2772457 RepID=UPI001C062D9B|nr:alpha/beta hydrolase [Pelorhabdus rhamnosifermentans]MBU2699109.1 pimeloyl-ACP methyl ester carboxylesterase [Pelorhabdus rhamnosifermentans]
MIFPVNEKAFGQSFHEESVELPMAQGILKGTLELPETTEPCPVLLIIAGSGPTDRDGNNPFGLTPNNLKMLADNLAQQGIASLRYDKRGIGKSIFNIKEKDVVIEDYVQDANALVTKLRQDKRFSSVIIAGHSEGAFVGILVAQQQPIDGLISLAGPGYPLQKIILRQISERQPQLYQASADIITKLEQGTRVKVNDPALQSLFRSSVQPFLISEFRYNPSTEISKVKIPILLIQGTRDLQLQVADAKSLQLANPNAKLVIIDGMNHILKFVPNDIQSNINSYSDPIRPLAAPLIPAITDFIKQISMDGNK